MTEQFFWSSSNSFHATKSRRQDTIWLFQSDCSENFGPTIISGFSLTLPYGAVTLYDDQLHGRQHQGKFVVKEKHF